MHMGVWINPFTFHHWILFKRYRIGKENLLDFKGKSREQNGDLGKKQWMWLYSNEKYYFLMLPLHGAVFGVFSLHSTDIKKNQKHWSLGRWEGGKDGKGEQPIRKAPLGAFIINEYIIWYWLIHRKDFQNAKVQFYNESTLPQPFLTKTSLSFFSALMTSKNSFCFSSIPSTMSTLTGST